MEALELLSVVVSTFIEFFYLTNPCYKKYFLQNITKEHIYI